jgi:hypothetical protein
MPTMTRYFGDITATNTDLLAGSDLEAVPFSGTMALYGASTVGDGTVTVTTPSQAGVGAPLRAGNVPLRAGPELRKDEDLPMAIFPVQKGDQVTINYTEVTAATVVFCVVLGT